MLQYSFITESFKDNLSKFFNADSIGKRLTYIAAGGYAGATVGGVIGTLHGIQLYKDREKSVEEMEKKILDPETSIYTRQKLIDAKNLIQSMTDEEYRSYIIKASYEKGKHIGGAIGTILGGGLKVKA